MYGRKVKLRFFYIINFDNIIFIHFSYFKIFRENVVYFQSPSEIKVLPEIIKKKIRVGGW